MSNCLHAYISICYNTPQIGRATLFELALYFYRHNYTLSSLVGSWAITVLSFTQSALPPSLILNLEETLQSKIIKVSRLPLIKLMGRGAKKTVLKKRLLYIISVHTVNGRVKKFHAFMLKYFHTRAGHMKIF